jgi:hypothetical protein
MKSSEKGIGPCAKTETAPKISSATSTTIVDSPSLPKRFFASFIKKPPVEIKEF